MRRQISGKPDGTNPLIYTGSVPNMVIMNQRPTVTDGLNWPIGYWWIIPVSSAFTTGEVWVLVSVAQSIATWKRLHGGGGPTPPSNLSSINKIYLTSSGSGTYIPTTGMTECYVECIGAGGSGNTVNSASTFNFYVNAPGGAGAYTSKLYTAAQIGASQSYTVGSGGIAPTANASANGVNGGNTTFLGMTAGGGQGGQYISAGNSNETSLGGTPSGGDINMYGGEGTWNVIYNAGITPFAFTFRAFAGTSFYGQGPSYILVNTTGQTGPAGSNGSGGGAVAYQNVGPGLVIGGTGGNGMIIITEYIS